MIFLPNRYKFVPLFFLVSFIVMYIAAGVLWSTLAHGDWFNPRSRFIAGWEQTVKSLLSLIEEIIEIITNTSINAYKTVL